MKNYRSTPITIKQQGAPVLSQDVAYVLKEGEEIVALTIDMHSKYCEIGGSISGSNGDCGILVGAKETSLYLDENKDKDSYTEIYFPEFDGWDCIASNGGRYSLYVCLIKKD